MFSVRPIPRPTIRELTNFLLSPPTTPHRTRRCISHLSQKHKSKPVIHHPRTLPRRHLTTSSSSSFSSSHSSSTAPKSRDRGPRSSESTQTDFGLLDVLGNTPRPSTSIDACLWDGFHLDSGVKIMGGRGVLLCAGEAFGWCPWEAGNGDEGESGSGGNEYGLRAGSERLRLVNEKGQFDVGNEAWGFLELVWPKPDLLILGLGKDMRPISPRVRRHINSLGIRVDIQDTRNAAAQYNLLATERGIGNVAAALIPIGWREGVGVVS